MKQIIFFFALITSIYNYSQFEQLGNYQNLTSLSVFNPAFSGEKSFASININKNIFGNSELYNISYNNHLNGFNLSHFNYGYNLNKLYNRNTTSIQYARLIRLSRKINLRLGSSIGQNSFPVYYSNNEVVRETHFTIKVGATIENRQFYFGVSGLNIPITNWNNNLSSNILSIQTGIKFRLKNSYIIPSLRLLRYNFGYNSLLYNIQYQFKWLEINLGYNNYSQYILGLGVEYKRFNLRYSHGFHHSKLSIGILSDHNFQLTYQFRSKLKCKIRYSNNFF